MSRWMGPYPSPGFPQQASSSVLQPLMACFSGEITTHKTGVPLGAPRVAGSVTGVWLTVGRMGKDDSNPLAAEANVYVNGTTVLSTKPKLLHVSGEAAATQKTSVSDEDTGVTQAVLASTNTFNAGDLISVDLVLTRTASPTTEMANACIVVELDPGS